jgi:hypothetical protein
MFVKHRWHTNEYRKLTSLFGVHERVGHCSLERRRYLVVALGLCSELAWNGRFLPPRRLTSLGTAVHAAHV